MSTGSTPSSDFKRKRNFTEEEKNFLVELVKQHQDVITSKDNKSSMKVLKDKVWNEIYQAFNEKNGEFTESNGGKHSNGSSNGLSSSSHTTRTLDQLKKCWENLRTKAKREYKQLNVIQTPEENRLQNKIISIIGDELDLPTGNNLINSKTSLIGTGSGGQMIDAIALNGEAEIGLIELNDEGNGISVKSVNLAGLTDCPMTTAALTKQQLKQLMLGRLMVSRKQDSSNSDTRNDSACNESDDDKLKLKLILNEETNSNDSDCEVKRELEAELNEELDEDEDLDEDMDDELDDELEMLEEEPITSLSNSVYLKAAKNRRLKSNAKKLCKQIKSKTKVELNGGNGELIIPIEEDKDEDEEMDDDEQEVDEDDDDEEEEDEDELEEDEDEDNRDTIEENNSEEVELDEEMEEEEESDEEPKTNKYHIRSRSKKRTVKVAVNTRSAKATNNCKQSKVKRLQRPTTRRSNGVTSISNSDKPHVGSVNGFKRVVNEPICSFSTNSTGNGIGFHGNKSKLAVETDKSSALKDVLQELKVKEQRTRLRMARVELATSRRKADFELELIWIQLENERKRRQLLEKQLENEQMLHRLYRKKIDKL